MAATVDGAFAGIDLAIGPNSTIELRGSLQTAGMAGFFFDYYGADEYKFAGVAADSDEFVIGHVGNSGALVIDASADLTLATGPDYEIRVTLKSPTVLGGPVLGDNYRPTRAEIPGSVLRGAIGFASAIPQSIEQVGRFAHGLEKRGIALTPASALLSRAGGGPQAGRRP